MGRYCHSECYWTTSTFTIFCHRQTELPQKIYLNIFYASNAKAGLHVAEYRNTEGGEEQCQIKVKSEAAILLTKITRSALQNQVVPLNCSVAQTIID